MGHDSFICECGMSHMVRSGVGRVATHCNALQHTITHCNTLQHTATHCNCNTLQLQHFAAHCNSPQLQHTATRCDTLQHTATYCNCKIMQHAATATHCKTRYVVGDALRSWSVRGYQVREALKSHVRKSLVGQFRGLV